jgi:3-polyprenyl-4-hydroxybenzoate decarboxylase
MTTSQATNRGVYRDIREYLDELDRRGLLRRVTRRTNKDTEVMPLVRRQFRGLDSSQRKGWLFENLTDSRGRSFDGSVPVAILRASNEVYAAAMGVDSAEDIATKWEQAQQHPIPPGVAGAASAPVKQNKILGEDVAASGGVDRFPVTVTNPGSDASAYFSAPIWITKDPETGIYNAGTYRVMVKAADRLGCLMLSGQDGRGHWEKARALGQPLEAVLVLSPPPALSLCSVNKMDQPEYDVAGALNGAPLELVPAETVDLLVPATAEIAIEGRFRTDILEMEGYRSAPILQAFISEMPPSESSMLRKFGFEGFMAHELAAKSPNFRKVSFLEIAGSAQVIVIQLHNPVPGEAWNALRAVASSRNAPAWKWVISVDDDIDSDDLDSMMWALAWRVQPHKDIEIHRGRNTDLDPSGAPVEDTFAERTYPDGLGASQILIDATRNWAYPPVSLPAKQLMEHAKQIWEDELKLPALTPRAPWFGYDLGYWPDSWERAAQRAVHGEYLDTGKEYEQFRTRSSYFDDGTVQPPQENS